MEEESLNSNTTMTHTNFDLPFMCGFCHSQYETEEQFGLHLQSHAVNIFNHSNAQTEVKPDSDSRRESRMIRCQLCKHHFETISTFHNHFISCGKSSSYIFDYETLQAYPLSVFCMYFEKREYLHQELNEESLTNDNKAIFKDYIDALDSLVHREMNKSNGSGYHISDSTTQTLFTENMGTHIRIKSEELTNNTRNVVNDEVSTNINLRILPRPGKSPNRSKAKELKRDMTSLKKRGGKNKQALKIRVVHVDTGLESCGNEHKQVEKIQLESAKLIDPIKNTNTEDSASDTEIDSMYGEKNIKPLTKDDDLDAQHEEGENLIEAETVISSTEITKKGKKVTSKLTSIKNVKTVVKKSKRGKNKTIKTLPKIAAPRRHTKLSCEACGKVVDNLSKLKTHLISHSVERPHACDKCPKTFKYAFHCKLHMKTHEKVLPFYCEICGRGFVDITRLKLHSLKHTENQDRPYKCKICGYGFIHRHQLKRHMPKHTGEKKLQCDLCGLGFTQNYNLQKHLSGVHRKEKSFSCTVCDKKFLTNYQLKCHMMGHIGVRPYKCSICQADYIQRKDLRKHMKRVHKADLDENSTDTKIIMGTVAKQLEQIMPKTDDSVDDNQDMKNPTSDNKLHAVDSSAIVEQKVSVIMHQEEPIMMDQNESVKADHVL